MSLSLTQVQQTEFDELVKLEYRAKGFKLRDTIRTRTDVIGNTVQFRKVGQVIAQQTGYQNTIPIQDPGFTPHVATLLKWTAGTAVDEVQELTVNFDAKRELAMTVAMAIGRRNDQIIIDALNASGTPNIIPVGFGGGGNQNMTYAKMLKIREYFDDLSVPIEERFVAMSANNLSALMVDKHFTSRFYTSEDAVKTGTLDYRDVLGVNIRIIPQMTEGGLPLAGNIRTCFAWHKMSSGFGLGMDMRVEVNYLPREVSWFVAGLFFAGAVAIDTRGIVTIACDESVAGINP